MLRFRWGQPHSEGGLIPALQQPGTLTQALTHLYHPHCRPRDRAWSADLLLTKSLQRDAGLFLEAISRVGLCAPSPWRSPTQDPGTVGPICSGSQAVCPSALHNAMMQEGHPRPFLVGWLLSGRLSPCLCMCLGVSKAGPEVYRDRRWVQYAGPVAWLGSRPPTAHTCVL